MLATSIGSAITIDSADGVIDGRFFGQPIGVLSSTSGMPAPFAAPVYKTPYYGSTYTSTGFTGAVNALSLGSYPSYTSSSYPSYSLPALSATQTIPTMVQAPVTAYQTVAPYPAVRPSVVRQVPVAAVPRPVTTYSMLAPQIIQQPAVQYMQVPQVQYVQAAAQVQYVQAPPEIRYIESPPLPAPLLPPPSEDPKLLARIRELEEMVASLRLQLSAKGELRSQTTVHQTYKVKTFEIAAKLAVMDGTDDGMYNGLPIEVEGEGLYRDLVAAGRRPRQNISLTGRPSSVTTTSETYKVQSLEMAEKLSRMDGTNDGKYNGLPIEVAGQGLYTDLLKARQQGGWGR